MKACFLFQRRFAYVGHYIALHLKEEYGVTDFCGFVQLRSSYNWLRDRKDVTYGTLLLDEDIHEQYKNEKLDLEYLRNLEKEYGLPNLWPYLTVDRVIMYNQLIREYPYNTPHFTHEEMLQILQVTAIRVIHFLETERPDFCFLSVVGSVGPLLMYHIAKKMGIKVFNWQPAAPLRNRQIVTEDYRVFTDVEKIRHDPAQIAPWREEAKKFLEEFRVKPVPYNPMATPKQQTVQRAAQLRFLKPKNMEKILRYLGRYVYESFTSVERRDYSYIGAWNYVRDGVRRKIRNIVGVADLYDTCPPDEPYAFFPLHYEPEVTILLHAPFYPDQIAVIRQMARSLPVGYKLYVKDHPMMVQFRPRSYYKEIKKIPNVRLINPSVTSYELMQKCQLVTTIAGTAGIEAALLKKPVVMMGDIFYNRLSFVRHCPSLDKLPQAVEAQLKNFAYNEEEAINFTAALIADSAQLDIFHIWFEDQDEAKKRAGVKPFADLLAKKAGLIKKPALANCPNS